MLLQWKVALPLGPVDGVRWPFSRSPAPRTPTGAGVLRRDSDMSFSRSGPRKGGGFWSGLAGWLPVGPTRSPTCVGPFRSLGLHPCRALSPRKLVVELMFCSSTSRATRVARAADPIRSTPAAAARPTHSPGAPTPRVASPLSTAIAPWVYPGAGRRSGTNLAPIGAECLMVSRAGCSGFSTLGSFPFFHLEHPGIPESTEGCILAHPLTPPS